MTLNVIPASLSAAAGDLSAIGAIITEANEYAAAPTTAITPAAADEISAATAAAFSVHGQWWQDVQAVAADFHQQFVQALSAAGNLYQEAEEANAQLMRPVPTIVRNAHGKAIGFSGPSPISPVGQGEDFLSLDW